MFGLYLLTKIKYGYVDLDRGIRHAKDTVVKHTHPYEHQVKSYEYREMKFMYNLVKIYKFVM